MSSMALKPSSRESGHTNIEDMKMPEEVEEQASIIRNRPVSTSTQYQQHLKKILDRKAQFESEKAARRSINLTHKYKKISNLTVDYINRILNRKASIQASKRTGITSRISCFNQSKPISRSCTERKKKEISCFLICRRGKMRRI